MSDMNASGGISQSGPTSNMAIVSLVSGVLGLSLFPILGSIVAVVTGMMARREIRESDGGLSGDGLAVAGLILGWVGVGLTVLGICVFGVLFALPFCLAFFGIASQEFSQLLLLAM